MEKDAKGCGRMPEGKKGSGGRRKCKEEDLSVPEVFLGKFGLGCRRFQFSVSM